MKHVKYSKPLISGAEPDCMLTCPACQSGSIPNFSSPEEMHLAYKRAEEAVSSLKPKKNSFSMTISNRSKKS